MKKIFLLFLLVVVSQAAIVTVEKDNYKVNDPIKVTVSGMSGDKEDWIGIYPKGSSNDWENMIHWMWNGTDKGTIHIFSKLLDAGEYEMRVFFHNSFNLEGKDTFVVVNAQNVQTSVKTDKNSYKPNEPIKVTVGGMSGDKEDWIGIYPKGSSDNWENMINWTWNGTSKNATHTFSAMASGEYDVRVFFHNSFTLETKNSFIVQGEAIETKVSTDKDSYKVNEKIVVSVNGMSGDTEDWIGIYPKGSSNDWANMINWTQNGAAKSNTHTFDTLAVGEYDVRVFFHNSFKLEAAATFTVKGNPNMPETVYEDAEDSSTSGWSVLSGSKQVKNYSLNQNRVLYIPHDWRDENGNDNIPNNWEYNGRKYTNHSLYELTKSDGASWNNSAQHILQVDIHPYFRWNDSACFEFGVRVHTLKGARTILMNTWFGRENFQPTKTEYGNNVELVYPITKDLVFKNRWQHVKVDLQEKLQILEPNNRIIRVDSFIMTGGNNVLDNIKLTSR